MILRWLYGQVPIVCQEPCREYSSFTSSLSIRGVRQSHAISMSDPMRCLLPVTGDVSVTTGVLTWIGLTLIHVWELAGRTRSAKSEVIVEARVQSNPPAEILPVPTRFQG